MSELKIGEMIKELRTVKGVSQDTLADVCGVSMQAVSKWENGQSCPDISFLPLLADYFHVSIDYLLTGKNYSQENTDDRLDAQLKNKTEKDVLYVIQYRNGKILDKKHVINGKILDKKTWDMEQAEDINAVIHIAFDEEFRQLEKGLHVEVWGNANIESCNSIVNLTAGGNVNCDTISGNTHAGADVNCGSITGDIHAGADVNCSVVDGNVSAGCDVSCSNIKGDAKAGYSITCETIEGNAKAGMKIEYKK